MSGLIDALVNSMPSQKGGGYGWHRTNAITNLKPDAIARRDAWLNEVRTIYSGGNVTWRQALQQASNNR